ncbi:MAG: hypothetical protein WBB23_02035 [Desulforhopalus sp.]
MKNQDELITQAAAIITMGEKVLATETAEGQSKTFVNEQKFHDFRITTLSFLSRVFGEVSSYYQSFKTEVTHNTASRTRRGLGMLTAAKRELQGNWLETTQGAVARDILTDMLRLARVQFDQGNFTSAAIICGVILEKHLSNLCQARGIAIHNEIQGKAIPKKGLQLTGEAYKKKLYDRQDNKAIISWLELCDAAAKEKHEAIDSGQVKNMLNEMMAFLTKIKY